MDQTQLYNELAKKLEEKDDIMKEASSIFSEINKNKDRLEKYSEQANSIDVKEIETPESSYDAARLFEKQKEVKEELDKLEEEAKNLIGINSQIDIDIENIKNQIKKLNENNWVVKRENKSIYIDSLDTSVTLKSGTIDKISSDKKVPLCEASESVVISISEVFARNSSITIVDEGNRELLEFEEKVNSYNQKKNEEIDEQIQLITGVFTENKKEEPKEERPVINIKEKEEVKEESEPQMETAIEENVDKTPNIVSLEELGLSTNKTEPEVETIQVDSLESLEKMSNNKFILRAVAGTKIAKATIKKLNEKIGPIFDYENQNIIVEKEMKAPIEEPISNVEIPVQEPVSNMENTAEQSIVAPEIPITNIENQTQSNNVDTQSAEFNFENFASGVDSKTA